MPTASPSRCARPSARPSAAAPSRLPSTSHGITPRSIVKQVRDLIDGVYSEKAGKEAAAPGAGGARHAELEEMSEKDIAREIKRLEKRMLEHARNLEFEQAARVRDELAHLKDRVFGAHGGDQVPA